MRFGKLHNFKGCTMFRYDRLNQLSKERGVTKAHLCRLLGKSPYYLRDAEKMNTNITGESLDTLARALGVSAEYLAGLSNEIEPAVTEDDELWELRQAMKDRAELKVLFHMSKNATPAEIRKMLKVLELIQEEDDVVD